MTKELVTLRPFGFLGPELIMWRPTLPRSPEENPTWPDTLGGRTGASYRSQEQNSGQARAIILVSGPAHVTKKEVQFPHEWNKSK